MAIIKVNAAALRSCEKNLEGKIQELTALNQRLNKLILGIQDSWEGEAAKRYVIMMQSYHKQAVQMIKVLQEFKKYVHQAIERFEKTDRRSASRLRNTF